MRRAAWITAVLTITLSAVLNAHPHMWIDGTIDLRFDASGLSGITVSWLFDEFSSADMLFMYDEDHDGVLSSAEVRQLRDETFSHLRRTDYFIIAWTGSQQLGVPDAADFTAAIRDGRLVYSFFLPFRGRWIDIDNMVFTMFDYGYFIDFLTQPETERYRHQGRTIDLSQVLLQLQSEGYGVIRAHGVQVTAK